MRKVNVAIDGPAGAGKSSVAKIIAARLGLIYIDTGAMYRALTWKALQACLDFGDELSLNKLAAETKLELCQNADNQLKVICDGTDVTEIIRSPEVSAKVADVAGVSGVRKRMVRLQQQMAARGGVVMDGRDICSTVLPDAEFKFFLTASLEARAKRRWRELQNKGYNVELAELMRQISDRDHQDETREIAPMQVAAEAIVIDTDGMDLEQVVTEVLTYCKQE